jgi:hypothetical protein
MLQSNGIENHKVEACKSFCRTDTYGSRTGRCFLVYLRKTLTYRLIDAVFSDPECEKDTIKQSLEIDNDASDKNEIQSDIDLEEATDMA